MRPEQPDEDKTALVQLVGGEDEPATMGTVIAIGKGPEIQLAMARAALKRVREMVDEIAFNHTCVLDKVGDIERDLKPTSELKVGDLVIFGQSSGSPVTVDGDEYLVMREQDVLAVYTEGEASA